MREHYDVVVVGAGPAGLAAAATAASAGARVGLLDAQPRMGGQVWRHDVDHVLPRIARRHVDAASGYAGVDWLAASTVVAAEPGRLLVERPQHAGWIRHDALVLATGARELLLPFPGWTLPGVTGAGGLQALAKQGWPLAGKRVIIAGSGPLLLAAAATARRHGAKVLGIHEQARVGAITRFATGLWRWPGKATQAVALRARLFGTPYCCNSVVVAAYGDERVREVELAGPLGRERLACDHVAVGYGLVPNTRLARMLGCRMQAEGAHERVWVDARQATSVANVYAAGEVCGIGGRDCALAEGALAGHAAAGATILPSALLRRVRHARHFATPLRRHFALSQLPRTLAIADTIVCRCEDVPLSVLDTLHETRTAKLATRCGMGPCQGRICGTALAELGRFGAGHRRPPVFPARLETLATGDDDPSNP